MKRIFWILAMTAILTTAPAATNDLTGLLQKGLFEEEANRNLDGAISNYQSLATAFDKDRQVAATAIFRLGECYRKLGRTNEAAAQYQRIVTDFSDQQTLVTLSRQNLAGIGMAAQRAASKPSVSGNTSGEAKTLAAELAAIEKLKSDPAQQARAILALYPDQALQRMLLQLPKLQEQEAKLAAKPDTKYQDLNGYSVAVGPNAELMNERHSTNLLADARQELQQQLSFISERVDFILGVQKARLQVLQSAAEDGTEVQAARSDTAPVTDEEEKEIRRIQQLIQNSPDLINAPSGDPSLTPLGRAASLGQLRVAKFLLEAKAQVNQKSSGMTPLQHAASRGHRAMVELLLANGADVDAKGSNGRTALHSAAEKGFVSVTESLIAAKANSNARDDMGNSPLTLAVQNGFRAVAELLLAHGADPNVVTTKLPSGWGASESMLGAPLHFAALREDVPMTVLLLKNHADVTVLSPRYDKTALDIAAEKGSLEIARELLNAGANPNSRPNSEALTSLYRAVNQGSLEVVNLLLEKGADPNQTSYWGGRSGMSPLSEAILDGNEQTTSALLQNKADPNQMDGDGDLPLELVAKSQKFTAPEKRTAVAKLLISKGANINAIDRFGSTPLHCAVAYRRPELVGLLLTNRADVNVKNAQGQTPLDLAKQREAGSLAGNPSGFIPGRLSIPQPQMIPPPANLEPRPTSQETNLTTLLRQHGALDELPDFSVIRAASRVGNETRVIFRASSNDWNEFSLLTTILNIYSGPAMTWFDNLGHTRWSAFPFPDFKRITIHRPNRTMTGKEKVIQINLLNSTNGIDCTKDQMLEFGDVVEIPEREHSLADRWSGLDGKERDAIIGCLKGTAKLKFRDRTADLAAYPYETAQIGMVLGTQEAQSVLMPSSDLAHVKVTRRDAATGKKQEWTLDCSDLSKAPDLWIRDGDIIEVPEK